MIDMAAAEVEMEITKIDSRHKTVDTVQDGKMVGRVRIDPSWLLRVRGRVMSRSLVVVDMAAAAVEQRDRDCRVDLELGREGLDYLVDQGGLDSGRIEYGFAV